MATAKARLYGPALIVPTTAGTATVLFTVPSTEQDVMQMIMVSNPTNSAVNFTLSIGVPTSAGNCIIGTNATVGNIPANSVQQFYGTWPVQPGETVQTFASTASVLVLTIGGEKRTLG